MADRFATFVETVSFPDATVLLDALALAACSMAQEDIPAFYYPAVAFLVRELV